MRAESSRLAEISTESLEAATGKCSCKKFYESNRESTKEGNVGGFVCAQARACQGRVVMSAFKYCRVEIA